MARSTRERIVAEGAERRVLFVDLKADEWRAAARYGRKAAWVMETASFSPDLRAMIECFDCQCILARLPGSAQLRGSGWGRRPIPVVDIGMTAMRLKIPRVAPDYAACGRLAAEHFRERGFTRLAYCRVGNYPMMMRQLAGFTGVVEAAGSHVDVLDWPADIRWTSGNFRKWLGGELTRLPGPLGLFVDSAWTGLEALAACREHRIAVPERVAVLGCQNNPDICDTAPTPLSGIDANDEEVAYRAAELLDKLMHGAEAPKEPILVPPRGVVERKSTDILAVPDLVVAKALRVIWEHCGNWRLGVEQVAAEVGAGYRTLHRAFGKHLGRSVGEELRRKRLELAVGLLGGTTLKVAEIARQCGYRDAEHLRSTVKRVTGLGPCAYRRLAAAGEAPEIPFLRPTPQRQ